MTKPLPCPICGDDPQVNYGFVDAPYDVPLVQCATIYVTEINDVISCPMGAQGVERWNYLCRKAVATASEKEQDT